MPGKVVWGLLLGWQRKGFEMSDWECPSPPSDAERHSCVLLSERFQKTNHLCTEKGPQLHQGSFLSCECQRVNDHAGKPASHRAAAKGITPRFNEKGTGDRCVAERRDQHLTPPPNRLLPSGGDCPFLVATDNIKRALRPRGGRVKIESDRTGHANEKAANRHWGAVADAFLDLVQCKDRKGDSP